MTAETSFSAHSKFSLGIHFDRVEKRFGSLLALRGISLQIVPGEFIVLLGPNGTGKTTLLRIAALLMSPSKGAVRFVGARNNDSATADVSRENAKRLIGL